MGSYFRPLRRKFGCVLLVPTCFLAFWWAGSFESNPPPKIQLFHYSVTSSNGVLQLFDDDDWKLVPISGASYKTHLPIVSVDYFFIVIPLTLLSAYLLLSKPIKKTGDDRD